MINLISQINAIATEILAAEPTCWPVVYLYLLACEHKDNHILGLGPNK